MVVEVWVAWTQMIYSQCLWALKVEWVVWEDTLVWGAADHLEAKVVLPQDLHSDSDEEHNVHNKCVFKSKYMLKLIILKIKTNKFQTK